MNREGIVAIIWLAIMLAVFQFVSQFRDSLPFHGYRVKALNRDRVEAAIFSLPGGTVKDILGAPPEMYLWYFRPYKLWLEKLRMDYGSEFVPLAAPAKFCRRSNWREFRCNLDPAITRHGLLGLRVKNQKGRSFLYLELPFLADC